MIPEAIRQHILRGQIASSFRPESNLTGDDVRACVAQTADEIQAMRSQSEEWMRHIARARMDAIGKFLRAEIGNRIEGGESMDDATLIQTAQASGFRVVCAVMDDDEEGVESVVLYFGAEPVAGMKLRLFGK